MIKGYIMLGLAILFGLFVWIMVTLIATIIGSNIGKKINQPKMGAWAGFMLTMGGWIVYWVLEFAYIQAKVSYLCHKEAGITVYVTPEQYRNRIKLNNFDNLSRIEYSDSNIFFSGLKYVNKYNDNNRLVILRSNEYFSNFYISRRIFVDKKNRVVLLKENSVRIFTRAIANDVSGLKFWNGFIKDCKLDEQAQFTNDLYLKYEGVLNE